MTTEEYQLLESLLSRLAAEIGGKVCVIPGYIQDGYHIGVYSSLTGLPLKSATGATIEDTVLQLKLANNANCN